MTTHDFESLREIRNGTVQEMHQKLAGKYGVPLQSLRSNFNPDAPATAHAPRAAPANTSGTAKAGRARTAAHGARRAHAAVAPP
jgi:hypothetical protein